MMANGVGRRGREKLKKKSSILKVGLNLNYLRCNLVNGENTSVIGNYQFASKRTKKHIEFKKHMFGMSGKNGIKSLQ
jgi:hypothetical protein